MSKRISFLLVLLLVAVVPSSTMGARRPVGMVWPKRDYIVAMTFNVRTSLAPEDGKNGWIYRKRLAGHVIREEAPDVIALQEADPWQISGIQAEVPGYVSVTTKDGNQWRGYPSILYRKDRFVLKKANRLWLSAVPMMADSVSWGNPSPRCYTEAVLYDRITDKSFVFVSTHFDYQSTNARIESARQLARRVESRGSLPLILAGDFNETADSIVLDPLRPSVADRVAGESPLQDSYSGGDDPSRGTLHGFSGQAFQRIDMVLITPEWQPLGSHIVEYHEGEIYPSDHFPVVSSLRLKRRPTLMVVIKPEPLGVKAP